MCIRWPCHRSGGSSRRFEDCMQCGVGIALQLIPWGLNPLNQTRKVCSNRHGLGPPIVEGSLRALRFASRNGLRDGSVAMRGLAERALGRDRCVARRGQFRTARDLLPCHFEATRRASMLQRANAAHMNPYQGLWPWMDSVAISLGRHHDAISSSVCSLTFEVPQLLRTRLGSTTTTARSRVR